MAGGDRRNADAALITALAGGATQQAAAEAAGVSERTVRRRLASPDFASRVAEARTELVRRAVAMLAEASGAAVETLRALLQDAPPAVRLGAARAVLELGVKLRESEELEARIAALEAAAEQPRGRARRWG